MMRSNRDIPKRAAEHVCLEYPMNYSRNKEEDPNVQDLQIPEELLAYADQEAPCVIEYRQSIAPMVQPEPEGPTQGATPQIDESAQGPIGLGEQGQSSGGADRGEQRENEMERGIEGEGGALDQPIESESESKSASETSGSSDDERTESDNQDDDDSDDNHGADFDQVYEGDLVENIERLSAETGSKEKEDPSQNV